MRILAFISMFVDHFAVAFLSGTPYMLCRLFGRLAFPLFSWLVVEGSFRTSSPTKYLIRVAALAFISQPIYMCFFGAGNWNVCFQYVMFLLWVLDGFHVVLIFLIVVLWLVLYGSGGVEYGAGGFAMLMVMYVLQSKHSVKLPFPDVKLPRWLVYGFYPLHLLVLFLCEGLI